MSVLLEAIQIGLLAMIAIAAPLVVRTREPAEQAVAIGFYGLLFALLFFAYQAPDVALSQIVVGAVVLPLMILLTLGRVRRDRERREKERPS